mgnify:CR=1 FL=1
MTKLSSFLLYGLAVPAALTLMGCSSLRETVGLNRHAPDEFAVAQHAPLEIPADFRLYPPTPGAPRPQEASADQEAQKILIGKSVGADKTSIPTTSAAEQSILKRTGADKADPTIRAQVETEKSEEIDENVPTINRIMNLGGSAKTGKGVVLDPKAEVERLKKEDVIKK